MNSESMSPGATGDTTGQDGDTALLEFREVNTHYGAVHILKDVNLSIYPGELVCLLGGNASGKTTTLASMINHMNDTMCIRDSSWAWWPPRPARSSSTARSSTANPPATGWRTG